MRVSPVQYNGNCPKLGVGLIPRRGAAALAGDDDVQEDGCDDEADDDKP